MRRRVARVGVAGCEEHCQGAESTCQFDDPAYERDAVGAHFRRGGHEIQVEAQRIQAQQRDTLALVHRRSSDRSDGFILDGRTRPELTINSKLRMPCEARRAMHDCADSPNMYE
jgi:hypothetical protein